MSLPAAKPSPRLQNGVIYWYDKDTFELTVEIDIIDQDGVPVVIGTDDTVDVVFLNNRKETVKTFTFGSISGNTIILDFDSVTTALFGKGTYTYDIYLNANERKTLANENKVVVE